MLKRSKKILLEGTLAEFKNYPRGAEGREYVLMNIEEKKPDGSYAFYEKDDKGDIIPVSYKGAEGYDATEFIQFTDPEFKKIILENFNTNPKGGITPKEADAITDIGELFKGNIALVTTEDLALLKNVKTIPYAAFQGCTNLQTAVVPQQITSISSKCFDQCSNLKTVKIYNSYNSSAAFGNLNIDLIEFYGEKTFSTRSSDSQLNSYSALISNNVKTIGSSTFENFTNLTSINIPNSVTSIETYAFSGCTGLTSVKIPSSVTFIGDGIFRACTGLTSITVDPDNIVYDSRNNCNAIIRTATNTLIQGCNTTVIPDNVTVIGNYAFSGRTNLSSIEIPNSVTAIYGDAFSYCTNLISVVIPNSVTMISNSVFQYCTNLTSIEISDSVTSIGPSAFSGCTSLTSVVIPDSVSQIGGAAFYSCTGLTYIKCYREAPASIVNSYYGHPFNGITSTCTLYVPINSLEAYQTADYWKDFQNIVGFESEEETQE